jgi:hypothetical protein
MNMKYAINKIFVVAAFTATTHVAIAQTPYDDFAPSETKKEMLKLPDVTFKAYNTDTTNNVNYIELDIETHIIKYFDKNDSLLDIAYLESNTQKWLSIDPHASSYPEASPYNFVNNNPIRNIDPDGRDWFEYQKDGSSEKSWNWHDGSTYEHKSGVAADGKDIFQTLQGHKAVVHFQGSRDEKLGKNGNLFGEGAVLAHVTVYGPKGADDIQTYQGFTMSSDFKKWGTIADGRYTVNYDAKGKSGLLPSHWAVNARGKVPALDGVNPSPHREYNDSKTGIFIHASNNTGFAGNYISKKDGLLHGISEGCLLIVPTQYDVKGKAMNIGFDQFNQQLQGVPRFTLDLTR